jgi:DNA-binding MarR family transcriptional regulator
VVADKALPFDPIEEARRQWTAHGWSSAADGMAAVTSVIRAEQIFLARVDDILRPFDLNFARYEALVLLMFSRAGALPLSKVGQRLQVHPASVTNTIDRLEARGLVVRLPHPTDRRTTLAEITPTGRDVAAAATEALNAKAFSDIGVSDDDQRSLVRILGVLRHGAGDFI